MADVPLGEQVFAAGDLGPSLFATVWNGGASHRTAAEPITISSGEVTTVDFVLPPTATITGTVQMSEGYVSMDAYTVDGDPIGTGADVSDGVPFSPAPGGGFQLTGLPTSAVRFHISWRPTPESEDLEWWYDLADTFEEATPVDVVSGEETTITVRDSIDPIVITPPPVGPVRDR